MDEISQPSVEEVVEYDKELREYIIEVDKIARDKREEYRKAGIVFSDFKIGITFTDYPEELEPCMNGKYGYEGAKLSSSGDLSWFAEDYDELGFNFYCGRYPEKYDGIKLCQAIHYLWESYHIPLCDLIRLTGFRYWIEVIHTADLNYKP